MSPSRLVLRSRMRVANFTGFLPRNGTATLLSSITCTAATSRRIAWRKGYATQRLDVARIRADTDHRARIGTYKMMKSQGLLKLESDKANAIYQEFVANNSKLDHGSNVQSLAKRYRVGLEDITDLALVTYRISDLGDPNKRKMLPPSLHSPTAGLMLQGCAQSGDPLAMVHILTAVYLSKVSPSTVSRDIAAMFPKSEVAKYRETLEELCAKSQAISLGPDALTLKGLFLELDGQKQKARQAFELAITRSHMEFVQGSKSPLLLPLVTPWNALGYLLRSNKDPAVQAQARQYFLLGAQKADDPLSCYEATKYEPRTSPNWLQFTSKAAASGHRQATINLAEFYQDVSTKDLPLPENSGIRKALNWLLTWRAGSTSALAQEWLKAASNLGHKPSMLQLADQCESMGDSERSALYLRRILEPPSSAGQIEEWPQLVQVAQRRLATHRTFVA